VITVVIPVSPIKSHPDTVILDETLDSVRHHLPDAEIIVTFDGVRTEHEGRLEDYEEFIRRALWRLDKVYGNTCPFIFDRHTHQVGMLRGVLDEVRTPLLMYVESDTPLVTDEPIDWQTIVGFIQSGESNLVRLNHESHILDAHQHLVCGHDLDGLMTRTAQWSQRPHVATVAYYRRILASHFSVDANSFIEDRMHGVVQQDVELDGINGWRQHRIHMYSPPGNQKRSYTTDGRAGEAKYDDTQVF
jgi:hypothetical protein